MSTSASSQDSHGRRSSRSVLCSAVWMGIAIFFSHFYFFFLFLFFSTLACFPPCLRFLSPSWVPSCCSTLTCPPSIFVLCPQNKASSQQQCLWHDLTEFTEVFFPPYLFCWWELLLRMCMSEKADHSHCSEWEGTQSDLRDVPCFPGLFALQPCLIAC